LAKLASKSSAVALISLSKARALFPDNIAWEIAWEKLVHGMAARGVPYSPDDPDLGELWRKLSRGNPDITLPPRFEGDRVEFYIKGVRRRIGPIQIGLKAVIALQPKDARVPRPDTQEKPRRISPEMWILTEIARLKKEGKISNGISKTELARDFLEPRMREATKDPSTRLKALRWRTIVNMLANKPGLWPISAIE